MNIPVVVTRTVVLRQKLDLSQNFAFVRAARLEGPRFDGEQRYPRVMQNGNKSKKFRVNTWVGGQYLLDANLIATLSSHPAKSLLVTLQTGSHEVRFDPASADRIQFVLECT